MVASGCAISYIALMLHILLVFLGGGLGAAGRYLVSIAALRHLGPGFNRLEGYVFYATLYKKSPELIEDSIRFQSGNHDYPSPALDKVMRKIAWQAVIENPLSGVVDNNRDGIGD